VVRVLGHHPVRNVTPTTPPGHAYVNTASTPGATARPTTRSARTARSRRS
jgi:hypothetical protein